jgi:hypothetical protein
MLRAVFQYQFVLHTPLYNLARRAIRFARNEEPVLQSMQSVSKQPERNVRA